MAPAPAAPWRRKKSERDCSILHETTLPYCPYQNAKQEVFWARVEGRLMAMLDGAQELRLELLNEATQAWVEREYHRTLHSELGCTPLERYLAGLDVGRESLGSEDLRRAFRAAISRTLRRSDGSISLAGRRFEIPFRYRHLERVRPPAGGSAMRSRPAVSGEKQ